MIVPFAYDVVDYPSAALPQAHPGHLFAVARMFGCPAAPPLRCRMLEVGCGDGLHLIACAVGLPDATFVGLDLSAAAVARGNRMIAELGLGNITLLAADVTTWEPPAEPFDYAVAHGLYSWVPPFVRDAVLALFTRVLTPSGIGYVSYNTYPGCHVRRMLWEMLKFHSAGHDEPAAKIGQAVEMAKFLLAGHQKGKEAGLAFLKAELDGVLESKNQQVLFHDDLGEVNDPVYFHEFAAHAARHGLRFVAEAEPHVMEPRAFPADVAGILHGMAATDVLVKEQYLDFLRVRRFRQTLLARDGAAPLAEPIPAALQELFVSGQPKADGDGVDLSPGVPVTFRAARDAVARTDFPLAKAALQILADHWPARVSFAALANRSAAKIGIPAASAEDTAKLAELLTAVWMTGMIDIHGHLPAYAETVSEYPAACPLTRVQARLGPTVTTRLHTAMRFEDGPSRTLVQLLDGTRGRQQIATELAAVFPPDNRPDPAALLAGLDRNLARLAKSGLLVE